MAKITRGAKKPQHSADVDARFARVAEAFAKDPQVTFGKMFSSMGLKVGGKIFAMFVKGAFVAKLPKERVEELVRRRTGVHFDPGPGRLMKEWIAVEGTEELWGDQGHLRRCENVRGVVAMTLSSGCGDHAPTRRRTGFRTWVTPVPPECGPAALAQASVVVNCDTGRRFAVRLPVV